MCGVVGVYCSKTQFPKRELLNSLENMSARIRHRGPDGDGVRVDGPVGFAHRRLSIIDLNARAAQPMVTADQNLMTTFNGEIYNFRALRDELEGFGHVFRTQSDTEVLLHGYRQWGQDLPTHLRGMFAFAIWDKEKREMFLARDRFGKKPLVYTWCGDVFLFASEPKAILEWPHFERRVDPGIIHNFMTYGYTPGAGTAFAGLNRLPPAHMMLLTSKHTAENPPALKKYWELAPVDPAKAGMDRDRVAGELLERLDDAIAVRLETDVPLGAFLSGGVDSSAVIARMSTMTNDPVKTFSVGFDIEGYDETPYAREVADQYGTDHRAFMMDYSLINTLPQIIWNYGEPYADSSALVTTALAHEIGKYVTVALSGDGGDEVFIGYSRYQRFSDEITRMECAGIGAPLHRNFDPAFGPPNTRDRYVKYVATFRDLHKQWGYGPALMDYYPTPSSDCFPTFMEDANSGNALDIAARAEVATYLPDDLLIKSDIGTMAASIEGRSPFLDHHLADWAASLPQNQRVFERHGKLEMKAILKYAMEPQLSRDLLYRKKQGFSVPVKHWIRHEIRDLVGDLLTSRKFRERGYFRQPFIDWMLDQHFSGREDHGTRIWGLLCLEMWHRTFMDGDLSGPMTVSAGPTQNFAGA
jgi:asparagine synthase (glutamine-hydrolysing)